jgi:hypothetical protein
MPVVSANQEAEEREAFELRVQGQNGQYGETSSKKILI